MMNTGGRKRRELDQKKTAAVLRKILSQQHYTFTANDMQDSTTQNNQNHFVDGHAQTQNKTLNYVDYFHKQTPQIK